MQQPLTTAAQLLVDPKQGIVLGVLGFLAVCLGLVCSIVWESSRKDFKPSPGSSSFTLQDQTSAQPFVLPSGQPVTLYGQPGPERR